MTNDFRFERFSATDLSNLRDELTQSGVDSWQAAEYISSFLSGRGYGVSSQAARKAASRLDYNRTSLQSIQDVLENLAFVM
jgi:hypothetical protein